MEACAGDLLEALLKEGRAWAEKRVVREVCAALLFCTWPRQQHECCPGFGDIARTHHSSRQG